MGPSPRARRGPCHLPLAGRAWPHRPPLPPPPGPNQNLICEAAAQDERQGTGRELRRCYDSKSFNNGWKLPPDGEHAKTPLKKDMPKTRNMKWGFN